MSTTARRRLLQDRQKISHCNNEGIDAVPDEDNIYHWQAVIYGPLDTIWEGGTFRLQIDFDEDYPNKPPILQFKTKIFHPNIYNDGKICIDSFFFNIVLQNKWSHMIDIVALLTSVRSLLSDPNPESPANQQAANMFVNNRKEFERRVKEIVQLSWKTHLTITNA